VYLAINIERVWMVIPAVRSVEGNEGIFAWFGQWTIVFWGTEEDASSVIQIIQASKAKVRSAWTKFRELALVLISSLSSLKEKGKLYKACVQSCGV